MKRRGRTKFHRQQSRPQHGDTKGPWEDHDSDYAIDPWDAGMIDAGEQTPPPPLEEMLKKSGWKGGKEF